MKILLTTATNLECAPILKHFDENWEKKSFFEYKKGECSVYPLVTGLGAMQTAFGLSRYPNIKEIDLAINIGLAGAYNKKFDLGHVVEVVEDVFGDLGVEEADGSFTDTFDLKLDSPDRFPFLKGRLSKAKNKYSTGLHGASGLTVNTVSGTQQTIDRRIEKYNADVETMEGAGFAYACLIQDIDFVQIRSISNYVEVRNRDNWEIGLAMEQLSLTVIDFIENQAR